MFAFLVVVMVLLAVALCVTILLQSGKGGGLASTFGGASSSTESFMGGHQAATALTKGTWIGGALFLFLGLVLSVLSAGSQQQGGSILQGEFQQRQGAAPGQQQAPTSVLESEPPARGQGQTEGEQEGDTGSPLSGEGGSG